MTKAYPNLVTLQISTSRIKTISPDDGALSALSFPNLTSLTLCGFDLQDGAFLLSVAAYSFIIFTKQIIARHSSPL